MSVIHFLNVNEGDCTWIEHDSKRNTLIDVSNARRIEEENYNESSCNYNESYQGNHRRKEQPCNPIEYLNKYNVKKIFRFILTHPDMDHMDGIKDLFEEYEVVNFWDTENTKIMSEDTKWGKYRKEDWEFYQQIRIDREKLTILNLYSGCKAEYYNKGDDNDGLYILAPTEELVEQANKSKDYNDCSYVILYKNNNRKIIFSGDSSDKTWDYILENYSDEVSDIDVLIAPHHGRKSGGNDEYLDVLKPKLTLFGNAKSQYLDYSSWNNRELDHITNNQADNIILEITKNKLNVYVTYREFALSRDRNAKYSEKYDAWLILSL